MESENNLMTSCWGPIGWAFIHSIVMGYPAQNPAPEIVEHYRQFFLNLGNILPCIWCKKNYEKNLQELPLEPFLDSRKNLALWAYKIHNLVNDELNVPQKMRPTFEYVYNLYESMRSPSCSTAASTTGVCSDPNSEKRCKVQFLNGATVHEGFSASSADCNVFSKYWYLIVIIILLIVTIVAISLTKMRKKIK